jgi:hypothetical protein
MSGEEEVMIKAVKNLFPRYKLRKKRNKNFLPDKCPWFFRLFHAGSVGCKCGKWTWRGLLMGFVTLPFTSCWLMR